MQTKNDIYAVIEDLKKVIPSFFSIPAPPEVQEKMEAAGVIGAIVIQDGPFEKHTVVLKKIDIEEDMLRVEYVAVDKDDNPVENDNLNNVVGHLVNYFLALEALKTFDNPEDS